MAGGIDLGTGARGGKKSLDTTINLVPFIDLMAVTISFLIMTAVWTQIGRLQVSAGGQSVDDPATEPELEPLSVLLSEKEIKLSVGPRALPSIPISRDAKGRVDLSRLRTQLQEIKTQNPNQTAITVQSEDTVRYDDLVKVIDECVGDGLPNVSVTPALG